MEEYFCLRALGPIVSMADRGQEDFGSLGNRGITTDDAYRRNKWVEEGFYSHPDLSNLDCTVT